MPDRFDESAIFVRGPVVVFKWRNTDGWPVEFVSPNAGEVFGYTPEQFLAGEVAYGSLIHPDDATRVGEEVALGAAGPEGSFVHAPYRVRHADGSLRWLHDVTQVLRPPGAAEPSHFVGYVVDITDRMKAEHERKELEMRLLHAQKLESLGVLAGGLAHDFNNLLTGILGEASLAATNLSDDQPKVLEGLRHIQALARRAADLTSQLLAYSGRGQFVIEPVDLNALVTDIVAILETVVSKKAVLEMNLDDVAPVRADRAQLQQVLMNLITNASDALEDGVGEITVATSNVGDNVVLSVSDTGVGMDDDVRAQLFDPFFSTKGPGRGLGMSAVQGIVGAHMGELRLTTARGQGTTFTIILPSCVELPVAAPPEPSRSTWSSGGTVLVIDDESTVRTIATKMLEHFGFDAITAVDGQDGIEVFTEQQDRVRLVVLDLLMPRVGGAEVLRTIRTMDPEIPVVLSSGYTSLDGLVEIERPDITLFVPKPYRLQDLGDALQRLLTD